MRKIRLLLLFLVAFGTVATLNAQQEGSFTIICYNVLEGLKQEDANKAAFVKWVAEKNPDVLGLMELNGFTQRSLEEIARKYGHPYAVIAKETGFAMGITSKYPITNVEKVIDNMHHGYLYARVKDYHFIATHLSPHSYPKRWEEARNILARAAHIPRKEKVVILGDLNSYAASDSATYAASGKLAYWRQRDSTVSHMFNLNQGNFDYSVIQSFLDAGYTDTYRLWHNSFQPSFPTRRYQEGPNITLARIDYILVNRQLRSKGVEGGILMDAVTDTLSDHYPVWLRLREK